MVSAVNFPVSAGGLMSKFKVSFKIEKLELEIEGSREDMPHIADQVGRQVAGMFQPAAQLASGEPAERAPVVTEAIVVQAPTDGKRRTSRRRRPTAAPAAAAADGGTAAAEVGLSWRHDTAKWGSPKKDWSLSNKIIYLLYVAKAEAEQQDLTAQAISETFNRLFKQAGTVETRYVTRELGRMKGRTPPPVSEDVTATPSLWFLNPNGDNEGRRLVAEAKGQEAVPTAGQGDVFSEGAHE